MKEQNCLENSKEKEVKIEANKNEEKIEKEKNYNEIINLEEIKDPVKKLMRNVKLRVLNMVTNTMGRSLIDMKIGILKEMYRFLMLILLIFLVR